MILRHVFASALFAYAMAGSVAFAACKSPEPQRFAVNGPEVYDSKMNVTWQRCSVGQNWRQDKCEGRVEALTWAQANKKASGKWRLPSRDELASLVETYCGMAPEVKSLFPDMDPDIGMYWSSTAEVADLAWLVGLDNGQIFNGYRTAPAGALLVHSGK